VQRGVTDRNTGDAGVDGPRPRAVPRPVCGPAGACGRTRVPVGHSERWYRCIPPRSLGIHLWVWHVVRGSHYRHGRIEEIQTRFQLGGPTWITSLLGLMGTSRLGRRTGRSRLGPGLTCSRPEARRSRPSRRMSQGEWDCLGAGNLGRPEERTSGTRARHGDVTWNRDWAWSHRRPVQLGAEPDQALQAFGLLAQASAFRA
jgi:hypothetical protein